MNLLVRPTVLVGIQLLYSVPTVLFYNNSIMSVSMINLITLWIRYNFGLFKHFQRQSIHTFDITYMTMKSMFIVLSLSMSIVLGSIYPLYWVSLMTDCSIADDIELWNEHQDRVMSTFISGPWFTILYKLVILVIKHDDIILICKTLGNGALAVKGS